MQTISPVTLEILLNNETAILHLLRIFSEFLCNEGYQDTEQDPDVDETKAIVFVKRLEQFFPLFETALEKLHMQRDELRGIVNQAYNDKAEEVIHNG